MAVLKSYTVILDKIKSDKMIYYKVFDNDAKTLIDSNDNPDLTPDDAAALLQKTLDEIDGLVHISLSKKNPKEKQEGGDTRVLKYQLKLGNAVNDTSKIAGTGAVGGNMFEMLIAMMNSNHQNQMLAQQKDFDNQRRHDELMREIQAAKKDKANPQLDRALNMAERYLIPQKTLPAPQAPINGVGSTETTPATPQEKPIQPKVPMSDDKKKILNESIHVLLQIDPDFIENLKLLADLAREKPGIYTMAISQLKSL